MIRLRNGAEAVMINRLLLGCSLAANFILLAKVRKKTETLDGYLEDRIRELKQKSAELELESGTLMREPYMGQMSLHDYLHTDRMGLSCRHIE